MSSENFKEDEHEIFGVKRIEVPDSTDLQKRIINASRQVDQEAPTSNLVRQAPLNWFSWKPVVPFAIAAGIALCVYLWLPLPLGSGDELPQNPPLNNSLTLEELEFQEALLLQDEMMFAQL